MQLFHLTKSAVIQIAKTVQAKVKFGLKTGLKFDMPVLGLAGCHGRKWKRLSRYVDWASPIHITVQQMRLRWMETSEAHSIPLLSKKFYIFTDGSHTHTQWPRNGANRRKTYYCLVNLKISWWALLSTWDKPGKICTLSLMQQPNVK